MNNELRKDYESAKNFWNTAFAMDEEAKKNAETSTDTENDWEKMAPSKKLFDAAQSLGSSRHLLDYGCGRGWASIIAAKSGCSDVTAVDLAENAVQTAEFYLNLFEVDDRVTAHRISEDWIAEEKDASYDAIFCSNVLDVVPDAVAQRILENFARIAQKDARVIVGMNYYMEPKDNPEKKMTVKNKNCVYVNDILRLVCRTDEEWTQTLGRYFTVEKLKHFAWPGEETERRRLFYLRKTKDF